MTYTQKVILIIAVCCLSVFAVSQMAPIAQDPAYHNFVDDRALYGISNFWNVISSLPFLLFGLLGLYSSSKQLPASNLKKCQLTYTLFFTGAILVCFGSSYYHLDPSTDALLWDRLPITIVFMALFSIILSEYISLNFGRALLLPLLIAGVGSVIYWYNTEQLGAGDLRPYALVQFLPMLLIPVILILFKSKNRPGKYLWGMIAIYALSKLSEYYDGYVFNFVGDLSGHSIKHLLASLGILLFYLHFRQRRRVANDQS